MFGPVFTPVSINAHTSGTGLWSKRKALVTITKLSVNHYEDDEFGELRAWFDVNKWFIGTDGLIYTDPLWIEEFKEGLLKLGLSKTAVDQVDYSEQGMQGQRFVSMDVGRDFIIEWYTKIETKQSLTTEE